MFIFQRTAKIIQNPSDSILRTYIKKKFFFMFKILQIIATKAQIERTKRKNVNLSLQVFIVQLTINSYLKNLLKNIIDPFYKIADDLFRLKLQQKV